MSLVKLACHFLSVCDVFGAFGIIMMLALQKEFGSLPSCMAFWKVSEG